MYKVEINYHNIPFFKDRDITYISNPDLFDDFISAKPTLENFEHVARHKISAYDHRSLLCDCLESQYNEREVSNRLRTNLDLLKNKNTLTVCTAHQPSLLTGPLYYIIKILSAIQLADQLNKAYDDLDFVPIFVHGSEDHDFEEINHFHLFNKEVKWDKEASGPVGQLDKDGLSEILEQVVQMTQSSPQGKLIAKILEYADKTSNTYGEFAYGMVHKLFDEYGLVQINMAAPDLKRTFTPIIIDDLESQNAHKLTLATIADLEKLGLNPQATPREINLFWVEKGIRQRIVFRDDKYWIHNTDRSYSIDKLKALVHESPESFSPNVILRPLYQEVVLPNVAYVGGGGEIAYWLERKRVFDHYNIPFPILVRRDSVLIFEKDKLAKWNDLGFEIDDFFKSRDSLTTLLIERNNENDSFKLNQEKESLLRIYDQVAERAERIDKSYVTAIKAITTKHLNEVDKIEQRLKRSLKSKEEVNLKRLDKLLSQLFPSNRLQERHENFMTFYSKYGQSFFTNLLELLDPLDAKFKVIVLDEK